MMITFGFYSCNQNNTAPTSETGKDKLISGQISISCDQHLQKITDVWIAEFNQIYPEIQVSIKETDCDFYLVSENLLCEPIEDSIWKIPLMREGIIPVISDKNPNLEKLLEYGMNKETLKSVFTGQFQTWGEIPGIESKEDIKVFLPERGIGSNKKWANFIGVDVDMLQGERFSEKETLLELFREDPHMIGILNACCAYDPVTFESLEGIIALPIDLNDNGRIDDKEELYDDLCSVERAVYLGAFPSELCNCIFLISSKSTLRPEQIVFIKWLLTSGQKSVVKMGFSKIRNSTADEIIHKLEGDTE